MVVIAIPYLELLGLATLYEIATAGVRAPVVPDEYRIDFSEIMGDRWLIESDRITSGDLRGDSRDVIGSLHHRWRHHEDGDAHMDYRVIIFSSYQVASAKYASQERWAFFRDVRSAAPDAPRVMTLELDGLTAGRYRLECKQSVYSGVVEACTFLAQYFDSIAYATVQKPPHADIDIKSDFLDLLAEIDRKLSDLSG